MSLMTNVILSFFIFDKLEDNLAAAAVQQTLLLDAHIGSFHICSITSALQIKYGCQQTCALHSDRLNVTQLLKLLSSCALWSPETEHTNTHARTLLSEPLLLSTCKQKAAIAP